MKRKNCKIIAVILICLLASFLMCGCFDLFGSDREKLKIVSSSMKVTYTEYLGYTAEITGVAKNTSGKSYSYASVEFSVYDTTGNNLGTAIANINNLASGDTWRFSAMLLSIPDTKPATYKLVEVIAW